MASRFDPFKRMFYSCDLCRKSSSSMALSNRMMEKRLSCRRLRWSLTIVVFRGGTPISGWLQLKVFSHPPPITIVSGRQRHQAYPRSFNMVSMEQALLCWCLHCPFALVDGLRYARSAVIDHLAISWFQMGILDIPFPCEA